MSVVKRKRKESRFEVFHHFYKMRKEITDLLLRDFGYSENKSQKYMLKKFGDKPFDKLSEDEKRHYEHRKLKTESFEEWFILDQRKTVMDCLRNIQEYVFSANSIYPVYKEELIQRRIHQDLAIGQCHRLIQEIQYTIETLPVDIDKYLIFAENIEKQIGLIKGWRKSDNKFNKNFN